MKRSSIANALFAFFVGLLLLPKAGISQAAPKIICYITIEGQQQGVIKGDGKRKGMEGKISGYGYSYSIVSPRDASSGIATGRRVHGGLRITKGIDISSPKLMQALVNNEVLKSVTIEFWENSMMAASGVGSEVKYYTVKLTNASITGFNQTGGTYLSEKDQRTEKLLEELTLSYQKIEVTSMDGGNSVSAMDEWR